MRPIVEAAAVFMLVSCALCNPGVNAQPPLHTISGSVHGMQFGWSVASGGDVNGDGVDDFVVGNPHDATNFIANGAARVYSGANWSLLHTFYGPALEDHAGWSVAILPDVNSDGRDEVIMAAPFNDQVANVAGLVQVFSGMNGALLHTFLGFGTNDRTGQCVAGAGVGDIDGDGVADYVVGTPRYDPPSVGPVAGRVDVVSGATGASVRTILGLGTWEYFGHALAPIGDVNGDGRSELAIGAPEADDSGTDSGSVRVYSVASPTPVLLYTVSPGVAGDFFGRSVAGVGDVNGDLVPDFVAGAPHAPILYSASATTTADTPGAAWVFSGVDGSIIHKFLGEFVADRLG